MPVSNRLSGKEFSPFGASGPRFRLEAFRPAGAAGIARAQGACRKEEWAEVRIRLLDSAAGPSCGRGLSLGSPPVRVCLSGRAWKFVLRRRRVSLPATVRLVRVRRRVYPGTQIARGYESIVELAGAWGRRRAVISMNHPLSFHGWTFYQSGYGRGADGVGVSTIEAVWNPTRGLPYAASLLIAFGVMFHFGGTVFWRGRLRRRGREEGADATGFGGSAAGRGGARRRLAFRDLLVVCGAGLLFFLRLSSGAGVERGIDLSGFAGLPVLHRGRLKPVIGAAQEILLELSGRRSLSKKTAAGWLADALFRPERAASAPLFLIDDPRVAQGLGLESFSRARFSAVALEAGLKGRGEAGAGIGIGGKEGRAVSGDSVALRTVRLMKRLALWRALSESVRPFPGGEAEWRRLGRAYRSGDVAGFSRAVAAYRARAMNVLGHLDFRRVRLESILDRVSPFFLAEALYGVGLLFYLLSRIGLKRRLLAAALFCGGMGFVLHSFGIGARMVIMARPPVTNLYSTFLFVSWAGAGLGLLVARGRDRDMGALLTAVSGLIFLLIAGRYAGAGDPMGVMTAVLNSNFWLTCHVTTITLGYAGCCVAGGVAHVYLVRRWRRRSGDSGVAGAWETLEATLGFGLTFVVAGTVFGGIWADQSWGQFWGWDPKENGALVIILWYALLFHAHRAGWLGRIGVAVGAVAGIQWILLAWFGVNMLGIGMHSYGHVSGRGPLIAMVLFFGFECAFVYALLFLWRRREVRTGSGLTAA